MNIGSVVKAGAAALGMLAASGAALAQFNPGAPTVQDQPTAATADLGRSVPEDRVRANSRQAARALGDVDPFAATLGSAIGAPIGTAIYRPIRSTVDGR